MNDNVFTIGTTVYCNDKECGKLSKVVINPEKWQVSDLVVEEGLLLKRSRVFPASLVAKATNDEIYLLVSEDKLSDYPIYRETVIERAVDKNFSEPEIVQGSPHGLSTSSPPVPTIRETIVEGVADHLNLIGKDTKLKTVDSAVGTLRGVAAMPENGLITYLLVHKGTIFVDEFWLSTSHVDHFDKNQAVVNLTRDELEDLIEQQQLDNEEQEEDVQMDMPYESNPNTNGDTNRQTNQHGSADLNHDTALASTISNHLMNDSRTADAVIEVIPERGQITLKGTVGDPTVKAAAEKIASDCPGVVTVSNQLVVARREEAI